MRLQNEKHIDEIHWQNQEKLNDLIKKHEIVLNSLKKEALDTQLNKQNEISDKNLRLNLKEKEILLLRSEIIENKNEIQNLEFKIENINNEGESKLRGLEALIDKKNTEYEAKSSQFMIHINQLTKEKIQSANQCKKLNEVKLN